MFRKLDDFRAQWPHEAEATLKVLRTLTDASLTKRIGADGRSLGRLAWHLVQTIPEMMNRTGLSVEGAELEHAPVPERASEIAQGYERVSAALVRALAAWNDELLLEEHDMYGDQWRNGLTLEVLIRHQAHHRGQMTVLMREAGLTVPGVYGPAREEWTAYGMPPQD